MRRLILGALTVTMVVLVAAVAATRDDGDRRGAPAAASATAPVHRMADARRAVAGRDYRVLRQVPGSIAHDAELLLPDGDLVLWRTGRYDSVRNTFLPDLVELWDPQTRRGERLPIRWPSGIKDVSATSASDIWVTFTRPGPQGRQHGAMHYDRTTRTARTFTVPYLTRAESWRIQNVTQVGPDGRIYFLTGRDVCFGERCPATFDRELWSFVPDAPDRVRKEADDVDAYAVSRTHLMWTEVPAGDDDPETVLHSRDLSSGLEVTRSIASVSAVYPIPLLQTSDRYVLVASASSAQVFDGDLRPVAHLRVYDHGLSGITDDWVAFGWTVFDPEDERFLQLAEEGRVWHEQPVAMSGDLILFPTGTEPRNTRAGTWTLARLRRPQPASA